MPSRRGSDGHRMRPPHVVKAILERDTTKLSILGRAGGKASAQKRKKTKQQHNEEQLELALQALEDGDLQKELNDHAEKHRIAWDDNYRP